MKIWQVLFYLLLIIFPFGQLLGFKLPFLPASVRIQPIDFVCFAFLLYWIFFFGKKSKTPFFIKSSVAFLIIAILSLLIKAFTLSLNDLLPAFFYLLRLFCYFILPWAFFDFFKQSKIKIYELLIYEGIAIAGLSVFQYLFLPDVRFLLEFGWDDHLFRAVGPFLDPGFNGLILVLSSIIVLAAVWDENDRRKKISVISAGILITIAIALTFSRMSYLLFVLAAGIILIAKNKIKPLIFLVIVFAVMIIAFPKPTGEGVDLLRTSTTGAKLTNYKNVTAIIKDNIWTGTGFNVLRREMVKRGYLNPLKWQESHSGAGADNSFLFVLATTGIFGFIAYVYYWFSVFKMKEAIFIATTVSLIISAFFINSLFYPWVLCWFGIVLAFTAEKSE